MQTKFVGQYISTTKNTQVKAFMAQEGRSTLEFPSPYIEVGRRIKLSPPPKKGLITLKRPKSNLPKIFWRLDFFVL